MEKFENISKNIQEIVKNIKSEIVSANPILNKDLSEKLTKLDNIIQNNLTEKKDIQLPQVQDSIKQVINSLQNTTTQNSNSFIDALSKIFEALKSVEQPKVPLEQLLNKKIPTEIKTIIQDIKTVITNLDPILNKEVKSIINELSLLKSATKLSPEQNIKEILSNDLKAVLSKVSEELVKSPVANQAEILKQVDKLSLQIDYYQLVSHLSNASSLYAPFSWEQMQDGEITIKHSANDKFYCDIDLKLKDYGELNIRLALYDKNQLNIQINSDNEEFKEIIKENIPSLRSALIDVQITPREIRLLNKTKAAPMSYGDDLKHLDIGFEVKG